MGSGKLSHHTGMRKTLQWDWPFISTPVSDKALLFFFCPLMTPHWEIWTQFWVRSFPTGVAILGEGYSYKLCILQKMRNTCVSPKEGMCVEHAIIPERGDRAFHQWKPRGKCSDKDLDPILLDFAATLLWRTIHAFWKNVIFFSSGYLLLLIFQQFLWFSSNFHIVMPPLFLD